MITDAIISAILAVVSWIVGLFPTGTLDLSALQPFYGAGAGINYFVDIPSLISVMGIVFGFELTMMTIRSLLFLWRLVKP